MDNEAERVITAELGPAEKLVWSGRPRRGVILMAADLLATPFSVLWCGFAVFWVVSARKAGAPVPFWLFGLMFVAVGIYLVIGRFFADAARRAQTFYGLTTQRAIVVSGLFSRRVTSLELNTLGRLSLTEKKDRSGTITLGPPPGGQAWVAGLLGPSWPGAAHHLPPAFEMVENARDVHDRIRALRGQ